MEIIQLIPSWVWVYGFIALLIVTAASVLVAVGYIGYICVVQPIRSRSSPHLRSGLAEVPDANLSEACRTGDAQFVKTLLSTGANPDESDGSLGITPLMWAAKRGNAEIVGTLLEAGANPLATGPIGTPLTLASQSGEPGSNRAYQAVL